MQESVFSFVQGLGISIALALFALIGGWCFAAAINAVREGLGDMLNLFAFTIFAAISGVSFTIIYFMWGIL